MTVIGPRMMAAWVMASDRAMLDEGQRAAIVGDAVARLREPESGLRTWTPIIAATTSFFLALILMWILAVSRPFDGPRRPVATLAQAKKRIQAEKVTAGLYVLACVCASARLAGWLWP